MIASLIPVIASDTDLLWQYLLEGDFLGFVVACYTLLIGEGFYAYIMLIAFGILYIRTRSLALVSIALTVLGSFFLLLAPVASPMVLILLVFGIFGILFSLFTGRKG